MQQNDVQAAFKRRKASIANFEYGIFHETRKQSEITAVVRVSGRPQDKNAQTRFKVPIGDNVQIQCIPDIFEQIMTEESDVRVVNDFDTSEGVTVKDVFEGKPLNMSFASSSVSCKVHLRVKKGSLHEVIGKNLHPYYVTELQFIVPSGGGRPLGRKRVIPKFENICGFIQCPLKSGVQHKKKMFTWLGNIEFDQMKYRIYFRGVRDVAQLCDSVKKYMKNPEEYEVFVNMVVLLGWSGRECMGSLLEHSIQYIMGDSSVRVSQKTDSTVNLTKLCICDWEKIWENVKGGAILEGLDESLRPQRKELMGNQMTISYTGSIQTQFHFKTAALCTPCLLHTIKFASHMVMQLVVNHC